ncbi:hypothetical protein ACFL0G_05100, partial [Candidatus Zixiibacteriota bacterium]
QINTLIDLPCNCRFSAVPADVIDLGIGRFCLLPGSLHLLWRFGLIHGRCLGRERKNGAKLSAEIYLRFALCLLLPSFWFWDRFCLLDGQTLVAAKKLTAVILLAGRC